MDIKETLIAFLSERYGWSEKEILEAKSFEFKRMIVLEYINGQRGTL